VHFSNTAENSITVLLHVACAKCNRAGRYRVMALAEQIGIDGKLTDWLSRLTKDCPRKAAGFAPDPCSAMCHGPA
jgi:hypothetical protein